MAHPIGVIEALFQSFLLFRIPELLATAACVGGTWVGTCCGISV